MCKTLPFLFLFASFLVIGQNTRSISGSVTNAAGEPLFGVTVQIKGTTLGTTTDFDGKFNYILRNQDNTSTVLVFAYLGYLPKEVQIGTKSVFNIRLDEDVESLDAVVITSSYGTKKRREEVVGSISSVKPGELAIEQPATSIDELLQGQVAGVFIETNPNLGEPVSINIRGQGSLTPLTNNAVGTSTQPLIIVDGIILTEELGIDGSAFFDAGTNALSENFLNPLARVGIQDIESIEVLKDAAAVGLYGADAANGVILITTKKGTAGPIKFNASFQGGISDSFNGIKYLNGEQYTELRNIYNTNNGDLNNIREWNGVNTNWFDLLNQQGSYSRYTVGASGGGEFFRFRGSVSYQNRTETQIANSFEQFNTALSTSYVSKKLNATLNLSPSWIAKNNPNTLYAFAVDPTIPVRDADGNFTPFATYGNPLAVAQQNIAEAKTFALLGSLNINYRFTDYLNATVLYGTDYSNKDEQKFFSGLNGSGIYNTSGPGRRLIRDRDTRSWNFSTTVAYDQSWNEVHNFDAIAGFETRGEKVNLSFVRAQGFQNFTSPQPIENAEVIDQRDDTSERYGRSAFTQLNYNFDKTYFLLVNFRIDQSSAFGDDNNTAFNGGAGASWVISNEKFFKENTFTDFLRLRASYGTTGNSRIGSYRALGLYTVDNNDPFDGYTGNPSGSATLTQDAPNPNLGWEKNNKFNLGLDWNIFNKLRMVFEVFNDKRNDLIVSRPVIPESGYANIQINGATMRNRGIEFTLESSWVKNEDFEWTTSFNIATLDSEILDLVGSSSSFSAATTARAQQIGSSTTAIYGFESLGIDPATGRELFLVDGQVYDSAYVRENFDNSDWVVLGDSQADFYGGLRNNFSYKSFNLGIITTYAYGADQLVNRTLIDSYNTLTNRNLNVNAFYEAWRAPGDLAGYPAPTNSVSIINSSRYIYDTSNFQLKSVTLSYVAPVDKWKLPVKTLSFNFNGSNLYTWYKEKSAPGRNGIAEFKNTYPEQRTFSIGINTTF
ncbi:TonB-linked outer membrane protein, SusC/RagA family [Nonlabens sp. Hel1_33_55]|uniref:SusC/RagA family TonB-linked outer membrane protein n=1 Tax=Nonlabens sp. Hel1_33_55 TaxID=1336802 RepID=UPI000875D77B|nr:SusC/RagA family TonB-linked outer membrane protein [Nonlabens sp. Hel1_33_55]SCY14809.1 TonB-linked outer membrane protein, SusC/RagA family [Nonlabens sp. Hel1_33_55]